MSLSIDYYLAPQSPWTYLGHARFLRIAAEAGATVKLKVVDLGKVFPVSGGLPLAQRPPQRQAYRLLELARWRDALGLPLTVQPKFFPVQGQAAARLIVGVDAADGTAAALALAGRVLAAVWAQERNIADPATLAELLAESGLPASRLEESAGLQPVCDAHTQEAIDAGVFGAPSYVVGGELFWGQDRLDFVQRRLQAARGA
jgi:2-hydroxychromene-2-carboxylate isomerase